MHLMCRLVFVGVLKDSVATGKDRTGMTVRESTGNFLFGNRRYGKVREIFRPGIDGTGKYGKFFVREWTVREILVP